MTSHRSAPEFEPDDLEQFLAAQAARGGASAAAPAMSQAASKPKAPVPVPRFPAAGAAHQPTPPTQTQQPAAQPAKNIFTPSAPQRGKVVSVTRSEVFGTTRTVLKVLMDKGGERTVHADGGAIKVAIDIDQGDVVQLTQTGHMQMEWTKVVAGQSTAIKIQRCCDCRCRCF
jgi:hypothetical protein